MSSNDYKSRTVSADFAVFLITFLLISTVIVFAVLLFTSYQNMYDSYYNEKLASADKTCRDVSSDFLNIVNAASDETEEDRLLRLYLSSDIFSSSGEIYVANKSGIVIYSNMENVEGALLSDDVLEVLSGVSKDLVQQTVPLSGTQVSIITILPIETTNLYVVSLNLADSTEALSNYLSILVYPAAISLFIAVVLFIGFTGLTIRPIRNISQTISKVSAGDLTARVDSKYANTSSENTLTVSSDLAIMARDVNYMIEMLENQEKDRSVFISSVAHDIRTPLTSINGFITAMLDGTIPPENYEQYLTRIKGEVDRIRTLVMSMTEASSLSHVDPELMEAFEIDEALEGIISDLEPQLNEKNINCELRADPLKGVEAYGEVNQLCRVITNVITNAIKFTPVGGRIIVNGDKGKNDGKIYISIEDSGPGVEPDKRNKVFDSFYKADPSRKQEGFGLGLYICKQILIGHNQTIYIDESPELGGCRVNFTLPEREKQ